MNADKPQTLQSAVADANAVIRDIRLNGWMKPWATYTNGERVEAVPKEDCARHRELRGREK